MGCDNNPKESKQKQGEEQGEGEHEPVWTVGAKEDDNRRYRDLLKYMKDRRIEARERQQEDEDRKLRAMKREESFKLLRLCITFLREKEDKWRVRKIEECERIREEEKRDRLAVCKEKKKRYGIKKISKEENLRLKKRTEERLDVASAKTNLWRKFGDDRGSQVIPEKELVAWEELRERVLELEEDGDWKEESIRLEGTVIRQPRIDRAEDRKNPSQGGSHEEAQMPDLGLGRVPEMVARDSCQGGMNGTIKDSTEAKRKESCQEALGSVGCQGDLKMPGLGLGRVPILVAEASCQVGIRGPPNAETKEAGGEDDSKGNVDGVRDDGEGRSSRSRCAPAPNCFGDFKEENGPAWELGGSQDSCLGGQGEGRSKDKSEQEEGVRKCAETYKGLHKRRHSDTFILETNYTNVYNDNETIRVGKLVEHFEGWRKESGVKGGGVEDGGIFKFGGQMTESPIKRRRTSKAVPPNDDLHGPTPVPWTSLPSASPPAPSCSSSRTGTGAWRSRPPSLRAAPATIRQRQTEKVREGGEALRMESRGTPWKAKRVTTQSKASSCTGGSLSGTLLAHRQTTKFGTLTSRSVQSNLTGSICTSQVTEHHHHLGQTFKVSNSTKTGSISTSLGTLLHHRHRTVHSADGQASQHREGGGDLLHLHRLQGEQNLPVQEGHSALPFWFSSTYSHQEASDKKENINKTKLKAESSVTNKETQKQDTSSLRKIFEKEEEISVKKKEAEKTKKKESGRNHIFIRNLQEDKKVAHLQGLGPGAGSWKLSSSSPPTFPPSTRTGQAASPPSSSGNQGTLSRSSTTEGASRGCKGACRSTVSIIGDTIGTLCGKGQRACAASVSTDFVCVPPAGEGRRPAAVALETDRTNDMQELSTNLSEELGLALPSANHPKGITTIHNTQMKPILDHKA